MNAPEKTSQLETFLEFFQALGIDIQHPSQLYEGVAVGQFIASFENSHIDSRQLITDMSINGAALSNFRLVNREIQRLIQTHASPGDYPNLTDKYSPNLLELCADRSQEELLLILKQSFIMAAKAPNSCDYIQKVLTLSSDSQIMLAELLKETSQPVTPIRENTHMSGSSSERRRVSSGNFQLDELELIDKVYELEQQNQRLSTQLKRSLADSSNLQQTVTSLLAQLAVSKSQNQILKQNHLYLLQEIRRDSTCEEQEEEKKQDKQKMQENEYKDMISKLNGQIDFLTVEKEGLRKNNQAKEKQWMAVLKQESEKRKTLSQQLEQCQRQLESVLQKCSEYEDERKRLKQLMDMIKNRNEQLQQNQATLRFELNYKNSQIQELKDIIMNNSSSNFVDDGERVGQSKLLINEFSHQQAPSSPRNSIKLDMDQLKNLRLEVKQLTQEVQSLKKAKIKNKQLEYERKKLLKILKEYQINRGEQNDILAGCLYELHLRTRSNNGQSSGRASLQNQKAVESHSTLEEDCVQEGE